MNSLTSIAKPVSALSLLLIILAPILFFTGTLQIELMKTLLLVGTLAWFISASLWMKSE